MLRRTARWIVPLAVGATLASLSTYWLLKPGDVRHGILPVEVGVLYRSGKLPEERLAEEIRRRGIKTVVNLAGTEHSEEAVCHELGVRYLDFPAGDVWCLCGQKAPGQKEAPAGPMNIEPLWQLVQDPDARPVLIHCTGGVHRTGVITALYRIRFQGWDAADAIAEMDLFGFESRKTKFQNVLDYLRSSAKEIVNRSGAERRY